MATITKINKSRIQTKRKIKRKKKLKRYSYRLLLLSSIILNIWLLTNINEGLPQWIATFLNHQ